MADLRGKIRALGSVNVSAIEEYKEVKARYDALMHQVTDVEESRNELTRMISKLSTQMRGDLLRQLPRHQRKLWPRIYRAVRRRRSQPCAGG